MRCGHSGARLRDHCRHGASERVAPHNEVVDLFMVEHLEHLPRDAGVTMKDGTVGVREAKWFDLNDGVRGGQEPAGVVDGRVPMRFDDRDRRPAPMTQ